MVEDRQASPLCLSLLGTAMASQAPPNQDITISVVLTAESNVFQVAYLVLSKVLARCL